MSNRSGFKNLLVGGLNYVEYDPSQISHSDLMEEVYNTSGYLTPVIDNVDHPPHYKQGGIETIDAIEAWSLNYNLGNCVKYISRAGKKNPEKLIEDLSKARWYLDREIANLKKDK